MSQIKKGALLDYFNIALTNVVGIILMPFIENRLGIDEYGLWILIGSFIGYIAVLDLGLGSTIVRFVSKFKAEGDKKGEENFLANTYIIYSFISAVILIIGVICFFNIEHIFPNLRDDQMGTAKIMFAILIFNIATTLPGSTFSAICSAYEHFVYPKSVRIVRYIIRSITIVAVLLLGGKAISVVLIDTLMGISFITANARYCFTKLNIKVKLHKLDGSLLKEIFSYSIWIFVGVLAYKFQWSSGQVILGRTVATSTTAVVAIFGVGVILGTYYGAFSSAITGLFLPRAMQMTVRKASSSENTDMMIKVGRISLIMLLWILCGFILYGKQFVVLWMKPEYINSYYIALIIMVAYTIPLVQNFADSILKAQNKVKFKAILFFSFTVVGMSLGYWLSFKYDMFGMIAGLVVGWMTVETGLNIYYYKVLKLDMFRFFKELFYKILPFALIAFGIGYAINYIPGLGWFNFGVKIALFTIVYFFLIYRYGTIAYEKNLFNTSYNSFKKNFLFYKQRILS